jgi:hypothetical protein
METAQYFKKARAETVVTLSINEPQAKPAAAPIIVTSAAFAGLTSRTGDAFADLAGGLEFSLAEGGYDWLDSNALEKLKAALAQRTEAKNCCNWSDMWSMALQQLKYC